MINTHPSRLKVGHVDKVLDVFKDEIFVFGPSLNCLQWFYAVISSVIQLWCHTLIRVCREVLTTATRPERASLTLLTRLLLIAVELRVSLIDLQSLSIELFRLSRHDRFSICA